MSFHPISNALRQATRNPIFRNDSSFNIAVVNYGSPVEGQSIRGNGTQAGDGIVIDIDGNGFDGGDWYYKVSDMPNIPGIPTLVITDGEAGLPKINGIFSRHIRPDSVISLRELSTAYGTQQPKDIIIDGTTIIDVPGN